jgi:protein involved in sex pheromone biosynthesis
MKKTMTILLAGMLCFVACNSDKNDDGAKKEYQKPDDAVGVGKDFISASLKGDYVQAESLLVPDSNNIRFYERWMQNDKQVDKSKKEAYKTASIVIEKSTSEPDSSVIVYYYNSVDKTPSSVRVVRKRDEWWVDFTYIPKR